MAKNTIKDLRDHLFETLEALKDKDNPMALDRAHAVSEVARTMINLAKVEVDMVRACDGRAVDGAFFSVAEESRELPERVARTTEPVTMARLAKAGG
jgi:hypothetical protein